MTELKTLKDLTPKDYVDEVDIFVGSLRQEAIKWIKDFREKINNHSHGDKSDPNYLNCISCRNMFVQIKWIQHSFNITDEDLK
ncbi:MAG TPA: hypothetical protein ENH99_01590 [Candidatus Pacearchaeota archaeon]|uniref:Uncharacterized protein n=1 Tax=marine sediment metagenome TaxID=412755 RepID=A0A0F9I5L7_9ZZZZ|nr:hypothetical protein [Candidatus Pacearchaeota archaeon]